MAALFFVLTALPDATRSRSASDGPAPAELPADPCTMLVERLRVQPYIALLGPIGFACPFLVGLWAGRRRILEQPERHRTLLRVVAVGRDRRAPCSARSRSRCVAGVRAVPGAGDARA